jgi:DNA-binding MarR family transcriptional regulator
VKALRSKVPTRRADLSNTGETTPDAVAQPGAMPLTSATLEDYVDKETTCGYFLGSKEFSMADPTTVASLTAHLGYWLRFVSNHVSHAFARKLGEQGVTVAEWAMLRELYDAPMLGPSRLAERMGLGRSAISKLAERLIIKRLIEREDCADDARSHVLALSAAGRALVPELAALADANDAEFFDQLTPEERSVMEGALKAIVERRRLKTVPVS